MCRVPRRRGASDRGLVSTLPQQAAAVLIGPDSKLFGSSKLHAAEEDAKLSRLRAELADLGLSTTDFRDPDYALFNDRQLSRLVG